MKYPFTDTPMNRKLDELISQCTDHEMIETHDLGRFVFHVFPYSSVKEVEIPDGKDLKAITRKAHIAVIDKEISHFSIIDVEDDIDEVLDAMRKGDLEGIYLNHPQIVNLESDENLFTYLDHYQELVRTRDVKQKAYKAEATWLIKNSHKKLGSVDAPEEIRELSQDRMLSAGGKLPTAYGRLKTKYSSFGGLPYLLYSGFNSGSIVRVMTYTRNEAYREAFTKMESVLDMDQGTYETAHIMLNSPYETYNDDRRDMYDRIDQRFESSTKKFRDIVIQSYHDSLLKGHMEKREGMSEEQVKANVDRIMQYVKSDMNIADLLISESPLASRNKLQILSMLDDNEAIFTRFMSDKKIKRQIEEGRPMKEVLDHLPLTNTSKRTLSAYMTNFKNCMSAMSQDTLDAPQAQAEVITEKGPAKLGKINMLTTSAIGNNLHTSVALMTTLPESYLMDEDRDAAQLLKRISAFPSLINTLSHRCHRIRSDADDGKNMLSWMPKELNKDINRHQTLRDATEMFQDRYYGSVLRHMKKDLEFSDRGFFDGHRHYTSMSLDAVTLIKGLEKTGEYRNLLDFDDDVHRDINQLFKAGKPDIDLEWNRTIDEDFQKNGYRISPITSNSDLTLEGAELSHCVGSYLSAIIANETYIFSLTKDGKRISTVEIKKGEQQEYEIVQHQSKGNTTPPQGAIEAANALCEAINNGEIELNDMPCDEETLDEAFGEGMGIEREEAELGLKFSDRDFILYTIDSMSRILPSFDVWEALKNENNVSASDIAELRRDFEQIYGEERSLESA